MEDEKIRRGRKRDENDDVYKWDEEKWRLKRETKQNWQEKGSEWIREETFSTDFAEEVDSLLNFLTIGAIHHH